MLKKNDGQIDIFNHMIFEKLIPKNHLLVKIDSIMDFSFVYEKLRISTVIWEEDQRVLL